MQSEYQQYPRLSPYLAENIARYHPTSIISTETTSPNHLQIQDNNPTISSFISYNNYRPENPAPVQEQQCYFCNANFTHDGMGRSCGECRKMMCESCISRCGKCGKVLCQLDRSYDYSRECDSCFDCWNELVDVWTLSSIDIFGLVNWHVAQSYKY